MSRTKKTPLVFHLDPEVIELLENLSLEKDKPASVEVPLPEKEVKEENNINTSKYVKTTPKISDTHKNVLEINAPSRDKSPKTNSDKILNVDVETSNTKHINVFKLKDEECLPRNELLSSNEEQKNGFKFESKEKTLSDLDIACEQLNSKFATIELADNSNLNEISRETSCYTKLQDDEVLKYRKGKEKIKIEKGSNICDSLGNNFIFGKSKGGSKLIERGKDDKNRSDSRVKEYDIHHRSLRYPNVYGQHLHRTSSNQAVNNDLHSSPEHLSHIQLQSYDSSQRNCIPFAEEDYPWNGLQFEDSSECILQFSDLVSDLPHLINSHESSTENLNGVATTPVSDIQNYVGGRNFQPYIQFQSERFNPASSFNELEQSVNLLNDPALLNESYLQNVQPEDISRSICSKDYSCSPSSQSESSCVADYLYYDTEASVPCGMENCVETVSEKAERLVKYFTHVNDKPQDDEPSLPVLTANDTEEFFKTISRDISASDVKISRNISNERNRTLDLNNRLSPRNYVKSHVESHIHSGLEKPILSSKTESIPIQCVLKTSAKHSLFHSPEFDKSKWRSEYERFYREIQEQQLGTEDKKIIYRLKKQRSTNYGGTNLHDALLKRNIERFYCILEIHKQFHKSVFEVNIRDSRGKTVLDYARMWNLHSVIEYLEENKAAESITLDRFKKKGWHI